MAVGDLAQYVVTGLLVGGVYALMSIGLALIFGVMRVVNFAQGDFMMLGMYLTWFLAVGAGVDPLLGALVTLPPFFLLGVLVHRVLLVRVTGGGDPQRLMDAQLILTLGLSLIITNGTTMLLTPMPRGILATVTARRLNGGDPREALLAAYADEPFVHVLPEGAWPHTAATAGSNACHLQATVDIDSGRIIVVSALDNLGKGAAGQAVQVANIMFGLPETAGLETLALMP